MKTLIVDDDFVTRSILTNIMKHYGCIDVVINADEAIEAYNAANKAADPYDLILLDRVMPNKSGDTVLHYIRDYESAHNFRSYELTTIIMVTGLNKPEQVMTSFRDQCEGYIIKPIDKDKVLSAIKSAGLKIDN